MKQKELKTDGNIIPKHYLKGGKHLLEIFEEKLPKEQVIGFLRCNVLKYVFRYDKKGGVEDLKKAEYYLKELIDAEEKDV